MTTFSHYIKTIGHADFNLQPLNEVDIAILVELVYLKLDDYVSHVLKEDAAVSLMDFYQRFNQEQDQLQEENPFLILQSRLDLAKEAAFAPRYRQIQVFGFQSDLDLELEKQFAAATYYIPERNLYLVVFRGTDDSVVGWKEDFNMSYQDVIPAQEAAVEYLTDIMSRFEGGQCLVAGHSKGANLAIYASAQVPAALQAQIDGIYAFDGPGFKRDFLASPGYQAIEDRIQAFQPEDAVVSQILFHTVEPQVVAARGISMMQHMTETWEIDKVTFKRLPATTPGSQRLKATLGEWVDQHSAQELADFFTAIFGILESTGVTSLNEVTENWMQFLFSLQKEVRKSEDTDLLKEGFAELQAIYKEQGQTEGGNGPLAAVQERLEAAVNYFRQLVPDALLPGARPATTETTEAEPEAGEGATDTASGPDRSDTNPFDTDQASTTLATDTTTPEEEAQ